MKKNIFLLSIALTFVSSVVWGGVVNLNAALSEDSKPKEFFVHVAQLNLENNLYMLSIPDLDGEKVEITIRDENDNVLYSKTKTIANDFCQAYRIEGQAGDIIFEVWNKEDKEVKTFRFSLDDRRASKPLKE